jgi:hypothetical protein
MHCSSKAARPASNWNGMTFLQLLLKQPIFTCCKHINRHNLKKAGWLICQAAQSSMHRRPQTVCLNKILLSDNVEGLIDKGKQALQRNIDCRLVDSYVSCFVIDQDEVVRNILRHSKLWEDPPLRAPPIQILPPPVIAERILYSALFDFAWRDCILFHFPRNRLAIAAVLS